MPLLAPADLGPLVTAWATTPQACPSGTARFAGQIGQADAAWPRKSDFFQKFLKMRGEESPDPYAVSVRYSTVRRANRPGRRSLASKIRFFPKVFKDEGGGVPRPLRRQFHRRVSRGQPLLGQKLLKLARLPAIGQLIENISQIRIRI
jgi:hypothetical protein